jgi:SAM-dependent methyltransferase
MQSYSNQDVLNEVLACPFCKHPLTLETYSQCPSCGRSYASQDELLDLRLKEQIQRQIALKYPVEMGNSPPTEVLKPKQNPEVDFQGIQMPQRMNLAMQSHFPKAPHKECIAIDLGCEATQHRPLCERAGYRYLGVDYEKANDLPRNAPVILGDAHTLPLRDQSVDFVLFQGVLSCLPEPHLAMEEIFRILKNDGVLVGTVTFLSPYIKYCCYSQFSEDGVRHLLTTHGYQIEYLAASSSWTVLDALAEIKFFPKMPHKLAQMIFFPLKLLHNLWWKLGYLLSKNPDHERHIRYFTGVYFFRARKVVQD